MPKNLSILLALALILALLTWFYQCGPWSARKKRQNWDRDFRIEHTDAIGKIFMVRKTDGAIVTLQRKGQAWYVNDEYKANPNVVDNLLEAISGLRVKYIPPRAALDHIVKDLATRSIKVQIFDRKGQLMKSYYVGGAPPDERGTYMIMEGAEQPYVMELPTVSGSVRGRYNIFRIDRWRDKTVLSIDPARITYVSIDYPKLRNKSFELKRIGQQWTVEPLSVTTARKSTPPDPGEIQVFLSGFRQVYGQSYQNDWPGRDSVRQILPFARITVRTAGEEKVVTLWPLEQYVSDRDLPVVDKYFADVQPPGDFMIVQHRLIKKILWAYDFFFTQPQQVTQSSSRHTADSR